MTKADAVASTSSIVDEDEDIKTYTCVDCGRSLDFPASSTNLVSMEYGWRLVREPDAAGTLVAIWRCPPCWTAHKDALSQSSEHPIAPSRVRKK
ncbi:MAG: hypothetical protein ACRELY_26380 [Polyangiaceae bacterium]